MHHRSRRYCFTVPSSNFSLGWVSEFVKNLLVRISAFLFPNLANQMFSFASFAWWNTKHSFFRALLYQHLQSSRVKSVWKRRWAAQMSNICLCSTPSFTDRKTWISRRRLCFIGAINTSGGPIRETDGGSWTRRRDATRFWLHSPPNNLFPYVTQSLRFFPTLARAKATIRYWLLFRFDIYASTKYSTRQIYHKSCSREKKKPNRISS